MSFGDDKGREILIPTVSPDGRVLSDEQAIAQFYKTGQHLGIFATPEAATAYAMQLHNDYANGRYSGGKHLMTVNGSPIEFALGHRPSALALLGDLGLKK